MKSIDHFSEYTKAEEFSESSKSKKIKIRELLLIEAEN